MGVLDLSSKTAFVFPGQGSQSVGMGRDIASSFLAASDIFKKADDILGFSISDMCFNGPDDELNKTINTQPALYVTSVAVCEAIKTFGITPAFTAGHSVGEYAALCAAGAFSFEDGLRLIRKRAELMNKYAEKNPGSMAAVLGLSPQQVTEAVKKASDTGVVTAANFNSPIQTVVSGETAAVKKACEIASDMGARRVVYLKVSGGFHSELMRGAAEELAEELEKTNISDAKIPVFANYTAEPETSAADIRRNLAMQITGSVRWVESVSKMFDLGCENFIELGNGSVLAGLIKRIAPGAFIASVGDSESIEALKI